MNYDAIALTDTWHEWSRNLCSIHYASQVDTNLHLRCDALRPNMRGFIQHNYLQIFALFCAALPVSLVCQRAPNLKNTLPQL